MFSSLRFNRETHHAYCAELKVYLVSNTQLLKNHSTAKLNAKNVLMSLTQFFFFLQRNENMNERIVLPQNPLFLVSFKITLITNGGKYVTEQQTTTPEKK